MAGSNQINLTLSLDVEDLVGKLITTANRNQLLQVIKDIDASVHDWNFTMVLAEHFNGVRTEWEEDNGVEAMERAACETVSIRPPKVLSCGCNEVDVADGMGHYGDCPITVANFANVIAERKVR